MATPAARVASTLSGGPALPIQMTAGEAIVAGRFVTLESDNKCDEIDSGDANVFGLCLDGASAADESILVVPCTPDVIFSVASAAASGDHDDQGDFCDIGAASELDLTASTDDLFMIIGPDNTESGSRFLVVVNQLQTSHGSIPA